MRTKNGARRTSIVDSFREPALCSQVLVEAVQCGLFVTFPATFGWTSLTQRPHLDVPFIACPFRFRPPITFRSPRSGERQDSPACAFATEKGRLSFLKLNGRLKRRPENSHRCRCLSFRDLPLFFHFRQNKTVLLKGIGTVRIKEDGCSHSVFPYRALNACERDCKASWVGRDRHG